METVVLTCIARGADMDYNTGVVNCRLLRTIVFCSLFLILRVSAVKAQYMFPPEIFTEDDIEMPMDVENTHVSPLAVPEQLARQRADIAKEDEAAKRREQNFASMYTQKEADTIAANVSRVTAQAAGAKEHNPVTTAEAEQEIAGIEQMKRLALRFKDYYSEDSEEMVALMESLEENYSILENKTFLATSLDGGLVLRCSDFNSQTEEWTVTVRSEILGRTDLFKTKCTLSYRDLIFKRGPLYGSKNLGYDSDEDANILIADALFRKRVPLLYARLSYKLIRWRGASEYRLVPVSFDVVRTDTNRVVYNLKEKEMDGGLVASVFPVELRTSTQVVKDNEKSDRFLEEAGKKEEKSKYSVIGKQIDRRALFASASTRLYKEDSDNFAIGKVTLDAINLNLSLGITDYLFAGGLLGFEYNGSRKDFDYTIGAFAGANYTFWSFLRPYIQIGTAFHTSMDETFSAGGGLDFMFGKLMFNLDYSSTWRYAFDTDIVVSKQSNKNRVRGEWSHYNTFAVGVGVNW